MESTSGPEANHEEFQDATIADLGATLMNQDWDMVIQSPSNVSQQPDLTYTPHMATAMSTPRSPPSPLPGMSSTHRPLQQRRTASASQVTALLSTTDQTMSLPTTFDPPSRSIFSSGPATASISVSSSTAQASLSAILPSSRPLAAALNNASGGRRQIPHSIDVLPPRTLGTMSRTFLVPEKDVDDPSNTAGGVEQSHLQTSSTISKLFTTDSFTSASPPFSRLRSLKNLNDTATLPGHLLHRGFIDGRHSDITILAFGHEYKLHKLILDRVPFFSSAFGGWWAESRESVMKLWPEETDSNITRSAFELALKRIYGAQQPQQEDQEAVGLFATACWLDMADLVDSSVDSLLRQMHPSKLDVLIKLVTNNYYGQAGDRILSSAKAMLCREGWEMPYEYWDGIPGEIIREIIGGDPFYVPGEWERWYLALRLLNRRLKSKAIESGLVSSTGSYIQPKPSTLKFFAVRFDTTYRRDAGMDGRHIGERDDAWVSLYTSPEIAPILVLLDEGIHYVHLRFEQLQQIRTQKDVLGVPVLPEKIISNALWRSMELRQRVVNAHEGDLELGLSEVAEEYAEEPVTEDAITRSSPAKGKLKEGATEDSSEMESGSWDGNGKPRKFWIPSNDISCIMGGAREATQTGNPTGSEWTRNANRLSASLEPSDVTWAADFTGTVAELSGPLSRNVGAQHAPRFSHYPPFRFSAEFPNPRTLKEKKRVYSQTVWYAGSMWNLYIQRVNTSKTQQLGIYLHRAKDKDPSDSDPLAQSISATVDDRIGQLEREMLLRKERRNRHWRAELMTSGGEADREDDSSGSGPEFDGSNEAFDPSIRSSLRSLLGKGDSSDSRAHKTSQVPNPSKPVTSVLNQLLDSDDENEDLARSSRRYNVSAMPPYIDGRPTIKTYFKIYSPSKAGRLLSIYESAPDRFNFSQSWGWKSSQMVLDDGLGGYEGSKGAKDGKLRYMVVIGNV